MSLLDLFELVRRVQRAAGVVHQKIDPSPAVQNLFYPFFDLGLARNVHSDPDGVGMILLLDLFNSRFNDLLMNIGNDDFRPFPGAGMGDRKPHSLPRTGDDGHTILQSLHSLLHCLMLTLTG